MSISQTKLDAPIWRKLAPKPRWLLWRYGPVKPNGKRAKIPVDPSTGKPASVSDPKTWGTLDTVRAGAEKHACEGIGFVLGDGVAGIDLDNAVEIAGDGHKCFLPWAKAILTAREPRETYAEWSPSGKGAHVLFAAKPGAEQLDEKGNGAEVYQREGGRYLTMTFQPLPGFPLDLRPAPQTLAAARVRVAGGKVETPRADVAPPEKPGQGGAFAAPDSDDDSAADIADAPTAETPMRTVNRIAIERLDQWFDEAFPEAQQAPNGSWRIEPDKLARSGGNAVIALQGKGIKDTYHEVGGADSDDKFGPDGDRHHGGRTPIDMLTDSDYEPARADDWSAKTPKEAARILCEKLELPEELARNFKGEEPEPMRGFVDVLEQSDGSMTTPPWPARTLPDEVECYAGHVARRTCAAEPVGQFAHMMSLSAMVPMGVEIDVLGDETYMRAAAFYSMLVGRSGSSKSAALRLALGPLFKAEADWSADFKTAFNAHKTREDAAEAEAKRLSKLAKEAEADRRRLARKGQVAKAVPQDDDAAGQGGDIGAGGALAPKRRRRLVQDATCEKLVAVMGETDEGLVMYRDELSAFFGGLDKYSKGSRGGSADSSVFLTIFDGGPIRVDRLSRAADSLDRTHLNVLGTIQPAILAPMLMDLGRDGLLQRFVACAVGEPAVTRDSEPLDADMAALYGETAQRLLNLRRDFGPMTFKPSPEALSIWRQADEWTRAAGLPQCQSEAERGFVGKLPDLLARVALALHCIDWATGAAQTAALGLDDDAPPAEMIDPDKPDTRHSRPLARRCSIST